MKSTLATYYVALAIAVPAALGGALSVYAGYDDAPGGVLLGALLVVGAVVFGGRRRLA